MPITKCLNSLAVALSLSLYIYIYIYLLFCRWNIVDQYYQLLLSYYFHSILFFKISVVFVITLLGSCFYDCEELCVSETAIKKLIMFPTQKNKQMKKSHILFNFFFIFTWLSVIINNNFDQYFMAYFQKLSN